MSDSETTPQSLVGLLNRLAEPSDPPPVSMMPETWGWAVLGLALLAITAAACLVLFRRYRANAYRRQALRELNERASDATDVARILRRTALAAYPRHRVAGLTGDRWIGFLNETANAPLFRGAAAESLKTSPYRDAAVQDDLIATARRWIRTHRREVSPS
ncbi:DUF4381 domain-containing protein [Roseibium aggregatum]|uniref:DUF4381 domain-containing protein n=1 Tax=Roseibium aggregatum TaxID=187304 RepID=A0A939J3U9_9HYPH|nr:DUF4381 domain-containing protein [Roseibium aggregatum]MBN9670034.1 DUF4381 domain-containing protein [Roseibium aggregatum]